MYAFLQASVRNQTTMSRAILCLALFAVSAVASADPVQSFQTRVQPLLTRYCIDCHGPDVQEASLDLSGRDSLDQLTSDPQLWFRVLDQLESRAMPPASAQQPSAAERKAIQDWITGPLTETLVEQQEKEGRARFRRLTRREFLNTFVDLFGLEPEPSLLPQDAVVAGYVKTSAALPLTSDGAYGYYEIASQLSSKLFARPLPDDHNQHPRVQRWPALPSGESKGHILELPDGWMVSMNSDLTSGRTRASARFDGLYKVRFHAYAYQTDGQPIPVGLHVGRGTLRKIVMVPAEPTIIETEIVFHRHEGMQIAPIPMGIGVQVPKNHQASQCKGPGLALQWLELERPEDPQEATHRLLAEYLTEDFVASLRSIPRGYFREGGKGGYHYKELTRDEFRGLMERLVRGLGERLFRRPVEQPEVDDILSLVDQMLANEVEIRAMIGRVVTELLTHPSFYCVVEAPGELDDHALASRLAYFLWNSTPDEQLLSLARAGKLHDPAELRRQTDRLLDDQKSARFVEDFLDQWLDLREIDSTTPDGRLYPEYEDSLKFLSVRQTRETFRRILSENRSVREFVAPRQVLVDYRLAEHYGLPEGGFDDQLVAVALPKDSPYGGLWTQPAILKVTADGAVTSPVKRGVWISERLLGVHIPPPPDSVEPILPDTRGATTLREQLALHSDNASCAACHKKFDPYGFALESFDVTGQFREHYRQFDSERAGQSGNPSRGKRWWKDGLPVDPSGVTPEGSPFADIHELRAILASRPEKLAWGVTSHLLAYATATPTAGADRKAVRQIVETAAEEDYGLRSIVHAIVQSKTFRYK